MFKNVQLFVTCLIDTLQPNIGESVVKVLQRLGLQVEFPQGQTCCGQPAFNAGMRPQARELAQHTIKTFEDAPGPIVIPSGSCTAMIRHSYRELFAGDEEWLPRAENLAQRVYELSEFIVDVLGVTDLNVHFDKPISYHPSCHLHHDLGVAHQPQTLLRNLHNVKINELPYADECCGFGGVFSVTHPEISKAILERKIANIEKSGSPVIVTCDAGCLINISGGLHRQGKPKRVMHIAEVLAQANV